jgi:hypothetical protein
MSASLSERYVRSIRRHANCGNLFGIVVVIAEDDTTGTTTDGTIT